jgi:hypothetical protein
VSSSAQNNDRIILTEEGISSDRGVLQQIGPQKLTMLMSSFSTRLRSAALLTVTWMTCSSRVASLNSKAHTTRAHFLSASAATFVATAGVVLGAEECQATMDPSQNPRYIDKDLEMKYGEDKNGNPRTRGMLVRRFTGDGTPYQFPVTPIRLVKEWPEEPPFTPENFFRADSGDDSSFYTVPRLGYHIDEPAVASLTQYYRNNIPKKSDILDICSSWVSHYPLEFPDTMGKICATGMNSLELQFNDQLTGGYKQRDLNNDCTLPYDDNSLDVVTCVVSIDYLVDPIQVLKEVHRVLRPGGKVILSQSNRCFPSKAIAMWLKMNDRQVSELWLYYIRAMQSSSLTMNGLVSSRLL